MRKILLLSLVCLLPALVSAQAVKVTVSGVVRETAKKTVLPFVNVTLLMPQDSSFVTGAITNEEGLFTLPGVQRGNYLLKVSYVGYQIVVQPMLVGQLSPFINIGTIELTEQTAQLGEITVTARQEVIASTLDKKTFTLGDNISQAGGSALEAMKNLPGVTVDNDGKVLLRGNDRVMVLIDGRQTALTGFGNQTGLGNIPASAIDKIEIINNPSAKYDANGNAG
ncbi:MAG: TonB-dependent receptor, partial [Rudanella sp.]|nr:TonB-dependent receptor [Rudanella sp.]